MSDEVKEKIKSFLRIIRKENEQGEYRVFIDGLDNLAEWIAKYGEEQRDDGYRAGFEAGKAKRDDKPEYLKDKEDVLESKKEK